MLQKRFIVVASNGVLTRVTNLCSVRLDVAMLPYRHSAFWLLFEELYPHLNRHGQQAIVMIEELDIFPPAVSYACITGSRDATVGLGHVMPRGRLRDLGRD